MSRLTGPDGPAMVRTLLVRKSANRKTGPVALAIYRTQVSCPDTCPLMGHGCYGENNGPGGSRTLFGTAASGVAMGADYGALVDALAALPQGAYVRVNVVGDYLAADGTPDRAYIAALNIARPDIRVLAYSHAWRQLDPSWFTDSTRPQASCDTVADVTIARARGWAAVLVVPEDAADDMAGTPVLDGQSGRYIVCPNVTSLQLQCVDCGLCARSARPSVVLFPTHGTRKRAAAAAIAAASAKPMVAIA